MPCSVKEAARQKALCRMANSLPKVSSLARLGVWVLCQVLGFHWGAECKRLAYGHYQQYDARGLMFQGYTAWMHRSTFLRTKGCFTIAT